MPARVWVKLSMTFLLLTLAILFVFAAVSRSHTCDLYSSANEYCDRTGVYEDITLAVVFGLTGIALGASGVANLFGQTGADTWRKLMTPPVKRNTPWVVGLIVGGVVATFTTGWGDGGWATFWSGCIVMAGAALGGLVAGVI